MHPTLKWIAGNRRGVALAAALALTLAAGVTSRALATRAPASGTGNSLFAAQGPVRLAGELEGTKLLRGGDGLARLELTIAGQPPEGAAAHRRVPTDVVVILDRSGSMEGEKLDRARAATRALLRELGSDDRFALVAYASDAQVAIPLTAVTRERLGALDERINSLEVQGGTNISAGLDLGVATALASHSAGRTARVIVISDGQANQGDVTLEGLAGRAQRAAEHACVVSSIGVGADFDERVMSALADSGTGNFYYLDERRDLASIFAREFDAARATVASALQVEVTPAPGVRLVDAAGYPLEARGDSVVFSPGALFAGQERRIWLTLSVPDRGAAEQTLGKFALRYDRDGEHESLELPGAFRVAWAEREADVVHALSPAAWERSVAQESFGQLEDRVAELVRSGDRQRALDEVRHFYTRVGSLNATVASAPVAKKLEEAKALERDVQDAFTGENQAAKQNELSKAKLESGTDTRRKGAKAQGVAK
jgi:Ca-activated chloride channel family protein